MINGIKAMYLNIGNVHSTLSYHLIEKDYEILTIKKGLHKKMVAPRSSTRHPWQEWRLGLVEK